MAGAASTPGVWTAAIEFIKGLLGRPAHSAPDSVVTKVEGALAYSPATNASGDAIRVAIFDTWPTDGGPPLDKITRRHHEIKASTAGGHGDPCLRGKPCRLEQAERGQIVNPARINSDYLAPRSETLRACAHRYGCNTRPEYDESDHGLFVADIVNDVAPNAELWVYRVFAENRQTDLDSLAGAIAHAIKAARGAGPNGADIPLILNLSFGFLPEPRLVNELLTNPNRPTYDAAGWGGAVDAAPLSQEMLRARLQSDGLLSRTDNRFTGPLAIIDAVLEQTGGQSRVLAVAAAGNDSCGGDEEKHYGPRLPAAIERVVAVAAFGPRGSSPWDLAEFSNTDDFFDDNDGFGAFGGDVDLTNGASRQDADGEGRYGSVAGLFVAETFPPAPGVRNETGWALWSGTSFAAPVVAGYAACLWSQLRAGQPGTPAAEVRDMIVKPADATVEREYLRLPQI